MAQHSSAQTLEHARILQQQILDTPPNLWDENFNIKCARLANLSYSDKRILTKVIPVFNDLRNGIGTRLFVYKSKGKGSGGYTYPENYYPLVVSQPNLQEFKLPGLSKKQQPISGSDIHGYPVIVCHNARLNEDRPPFFARKFQLVMPKEGEVDARTDGTPRAVSVSSGSEPGASELGASPASPDNSIQDLDSSALMDDWDLAAIDSPSESAHLEPGEWPELSDQVWADFEGGVSTPPPHLQTATALSALGNDPPQLEPLSEPVCQEQGQPPPHQPRGTLPRGAAEESVSTPPAAVSVPRNDPLPPQAPLRALSLPTVPSIIQSCSSYSYSPSSATASSAPSPPSPWTAESPSSSSSTVSLAVPRVPALDSSQSASSLLTTTSAHVSGSCTGSGGGGSGGGGSGGGGSGGGGSGGGGGRGGGCSNPDDTNPAVLLSQEFEAWVGELREAFTHGDDERRQQIMRVVRTASNAHTRPREEDAVVDAEAWAKRGRHRALRASPEDAAAAEKEALTVELEATLKQIKSMVLGETPPPPPSSSSLPSPPPPLPAAEQTAAPPASSLEMLRHLQSAFAALRYKKGEKEEEEEAPAVTTTTTTTITVTTTTTTTSSKPKWPEKEHHRTSSSSPSASRASGEGALRLTSRSLAAPSVTDEQAASLIERIKLSYENIEASKNTESLSERWEKLKARRGKSKSEKAGSGKGATAEHKPSKVDESGDQ